MTLNQLITVPWLRKSNSSESLFFSFLKNSFSLDFHQFFWFWCDLTVWSYADPFYAQPYKPSWFFNFVGASIAVFSQRRLVRRLEETLVMPIYILKWSSLHGPRTLLQPLRRSLLTESISSTTVPRRKFSSISTSTRHFFFLSVTAKTKGENSKTSYRYKIVDDWFAINRVFPAEACDDLGGEFCEPDYQTGVY